MVGPQHALNLRSRVKGQTLTPMLWFTGLTFAMGMGWDSPGMGVHVDTTAHFSS